MKNKYSLKTILSGALLTVCLASCDPLGIEPTIVVDEDRFWEDAQLSRSFVNQFYLYTPAASGQSFQSEQWSDNCIGWIDDQYTEYRQTDFTHRHYDAVNTVSCFKWTDIWNNRYKNIRATNLGIQRISTSTVIKVNDQKQMLAECYFFRALYHFELEQYYGSAPYIDKVLTVFDETMIPRPTREEFFDKILADLNQSIALFDESGNSPLMGMINANVVKAIKSRIALYAACAAEASAKGLYNGDTASGNLFTFKKSATEYYQQAFDAANALIGKYSLDPNYENLFTSGTSYKSVESIWPVMFNNASRSGFNPTAKNGPMGGYYGTDKSWDMWSGTFPTEDLVECYYQKDAADGKWKQWWKTQQAKEGLKGSYDGNGIFTGSADNYRELVYGNRDARFYATIAYDGSYMSKADNQKEMYIIQTWIDDQVEPDKLMSNSALHSGYRSSANLDYPIGRINSITGYYSRKYSIFEGYNEDGTLKKDQRQTSYFMIRYAEVLLNYAEAAIKLGKGDPLGKINEIRHRAGLDDFNESVVGHDLWTEYKLQRRIEFAFEVPGQRYFDLLRWGESEGKNTIEELNKGPKTMRIFRKGIETTEATRQGYPVESGGEGYFTPRVETVRVTYSYFEKKFDNARYYFVPFSESMLSSYQGLTQNPGWTNFNYK